MSQVFRVGSEYLHITKESPPAFKGVLFVCYRGVSPSTVTETVIPLSDIPDASAKVDSLALPPDWVDALRLPKPRERDQPRSRPRQAVHTKSIADHRVVDCENCENGLDFLARQLSENPATCLLLAPFTVLVIILWSVVTLVDWTIKQVKILVRNRAA